MKTKNIIAVLLVSCIMAATPVIAQKTVSMETLLKEITDRDGKARFPDPAYTCRQFSSYDRRSVERGGAGWFANTDFNQYVGVEQRDGREEYVMMDAEGPGSIVRIWMTFMENELKGTLRFYIDDNPVPAIEGPAWDIIGGEQLTGQPLSMGVSQETKRQWRGQNLYLPIPYSKRCKITYQYTYEVKKDGKGERVFPGYVFYNINYRTYDPSVNVVSWSAAEMKKNAALIDKVQNELTGIVHLPAGKKLKAAALDATLAPGESKSFAIDGGNAIRELTLQMEADDYQQALRSTVLEISFDGERTVWVPVGDFYGIGYRKLHTRTWYTQTETSGKMSAYWVMPFRNRCTVTLHNLGNQAVNFVNSAARYEKWKWDDRSMHFGSNWRFYDFKKVGDMISAAGGEGTDMNYALLKGKGVYMGDALAICNSSSGWWGEGDEKIFVDGERFPSHFGTGSEDYFGYAWCLDRVFTNHPFIAQPDGTGNNSPTLSVNSRVRSLDAIPFDESIDVNLELYSSVNYAPTAYWYMFPGGVSAAGEDIAGAQAKAALSRGDMFSPKLTAFVQAENMEWVDTPEGGVSLQTNYAPIWSGGVQVYWSGIRKGDRAVFGLQSPYSGTHALDVIFTKAPDYGKFDVWFNDKKIASAIDLYNPKVIATELPLGEVTLREGLNTLTFELVEYPEGMESSCFGFDRVTLTK